MEKQISIIFCFHFRKRTVLLYVALDFDFRRNFKISEKYIENFLDVPKFKYWKKNPECNAAYKNNTLLSEIMINYLHLTLFLRTVRAPLERKLKRHITVWITRLPIDLCCVLFKKSIKIIVLEYFIKILFKSLKKRMLF